MGRPLKTATFTQPKQVSDVVKSEYEQGFNRETGTLKSGFGLLEIGMVLGKIATGSGSAAAKSGGNTGGGTIGAIAVNQGAKVGVYKVRMTAATAFQVMDPDGFVIGVNGATGAAFADDIGFTITTGGSAFVAGDGFDITVAAGSGKYAPYDPTAKDGSQIASAVLLHKHDTTADVIGAVLLVRGPAEIDRTELEWGANVSTSGHKDAAVASLAAAGIVSRLTA